MALAKQPKRIRNPEERRRAQAKYYLKTKETRRAARLAMTKDWLSRNPEYHSEYRKNNPGKLAAKLAKYRSSKLKATPNWLTEAQLKEIETFYRNCPEGYEVDHIVPLQGKNIKGLHVIWNLQYLEKSANRKKSNLLWL